MRAGAVTLALVLPWAVASCSSTGTDNGRKNDNANLPDQTPIRSTTPGTYAWTPHMPADGELVLVDEGGTTFNLRGEAIDGPLAASKTLLRQLPGVNMFWFAWSVFYPGAEVWSRQEGVREAALPADKTGNSGCFGGLDCIPSLPNTGVPSRDVAWTTAGASDVDYLADADLVLGVFIDGVARAYPHNILWWHEIVNDSIGDVRLTVTFCPLTGSGLVFSGGKEGQSFGVSGQLFNSNLVMYDHATESLWPQLWHGPVSGKQAETEQWLDLLPATETTWKRWRELHPDTVVLSDDTGSSRDYRAYPYGDYRTNNGDTFRVTEPRPDSAYPNKAMTFGLIDRGKSLFKAYVHADLAAKGDPVVVEDTFDGLPILVVYDKSSNMVLAFESPTTGDPPQRLSFTVQRFEP